MIIVVFYCGETVVNAGTVQYKAALVAIVEKLILCLTHIFTMKNIGRQF